MNTSHHRSHVKVAVLVSPITPLCGSEVENNLTASCQIILSFVLALYDFKGDNTTLKVFSYF